MFEFIKKSHTFSVLKGDFSKLQEIKSSMDATPFSTETGQGFSELELHDNCITGTFVNLYDFEVKYFNGEVTTTDLKKKLVSCDFMLTENYAFATGDGPAKSLFRMNLGLIVPPLTDTDVTLPTLEYDNMNSFQHHLTLITNLSIKNPKDCEIRKLTVSGKIEDIAGVPGVAQGRFTVLSVQGLFEDSVDGALTIKITNKGLLTIKKRSNYVLTPDFADKIMGLTRVFQ